MICQKLTSILIKISNWAMSKCCPEGLPEEFKDNSIQLNLFDSTEEESRN